MKLITIGRRSDNDIVVSDDNVSRYHCQIIQHDDGNYSLSDCGSTNGTFVNGQQIEGEIMLSPNDVVRIGNTTLPWRTYFSSGDIAKVITIGRNSSNDVIVNDPYVGRRHCQIVQHSNGTFILEDFESANGTFVNDRRIKGRVTLNYSDQVRVAGVGVNWQQYFGKAKKPSNKRWLWFGIAAGVAIVVVLSLIISLLGNKQDVIFFAGDYPPVVNVSYEEDGVTYTVEAVQGQVTLFFDENVSHSSAVKAIKDAGGIVVAQIPDIQYYLVDVGSGNENRFMQQMRGFAGVSYTYPNMVLEPTSVTPEVIDNFDYVYKRYGDTHGKIVSSALTQCQSDHVNIGEKDVTNEKGKETLNTDKIYESLYKILSDMDANNSTIINMSFGCCIMVDSVKRKWYDTINVDNNARVDYRNNYIKSLEGILRCIKKYDNKDFVIVKSAGNVGVKNFEKNILSTLSNSLKKNHLDGVMDRHVILVSAKDTREKHVYPSDNKSIRAHYNDYSNELSVGIHHPWVTKVDISDFKYNNIDAAGTSYSSPRAGCYISYVANEHNLKLTEVLEYAREATHLHPEHLLTIEGMESLIGLVSIEGDLKMYLLNSMDGGSVYYNYDANGNLTSAYGVEDASDPYSQVVSQYRETDGENNYLAFVVDMGKSINVTSYLEEGEEEFLDNPMQSAIMIVPEFKYKGRDFAAKYANKRVRATGTLYVPGGGWHNATVVVMRLRSIKLLEEDNNKKQQDSPNNNQNKYQESSKKEYKYKMSCNKQLFESKRSGHIDLPNGDVINYQYRRGNDSDLRYSYGSCYYIRFTLANNESICKKYCILAKDETNDDRLWVGSGNPWDDEFLSIKPIDLPIYSESNQRFNAKSDNVFVIISQY